MGGGRLFHGSQPITTGAKLEYLVGQLPKLVDQPLIFACQPRPAGPDFMRNLLAIEARQSAGSAFNAGDEPVEPVIRPFRECMCQDTGATARFEYGFARCEFWLNTNPPADPVRTT